MGKESPYLADSNRLAEVIAAIQAAGTYRFYKLDFEGWADRISGAKATADHWKKVFEEHPEFFRLDQGRNKGSLVWRRQHPKRYDVDAEKTITRQDFYDLEDHSRISRTPLDSEEIQTLINAAISLHSSAVEQKQERRWWIPIATALVGMLVGALPTIISAWRSMGEPGG